MLGSLLLCFCLQEPALDPYVRDVRSFGATMDDRTKAAANSAALQAAVDSWGYPTAFVGSRTVTIPPGKLYLGPDVSLDRNAVGLRGSGINRTFLEKGGFQEGSVLRVGMPRSTAAHPTTDPAHWPSAAGKLDASASAVPRWGVDLTGDSHLCLGSGPISRAPGFWGSASAVVVEAIVEGPVPATAIVGASRRSIPDPVIVLTTPTSVLVVWATADDAGTLTGRKRWMASAKAVLDAGVHTLVVQVDLTASTVGIWKDGAQLPIASMAVDGQGIATSDGMAAMAAGPKTLAPSQGNPWLVGHAAGCATTNVPDYYQAESYPDFTLYGLRVSAAPRYKVGEVGSPLSRLDPKAVNHKSLCYDRDPGTVFLLPGTVAPEVLAPMRAVPIDSVVGGRSWGLLVDRWHYSTETVQGGVELADLTLTSWANGGDALTVGSPLDLRCERVAMNGADRGLSSWNWGVNYTDSFRECVFSGNDAAAYTYYGIAKFRDCVVGLNTGRVAFWNVMAYHSNADTFVTGFGSPVNIYRGTLGAAATFKDPIIDIESAKYPTGAAFHTETGPDRGSDPGSLTIDGMNGGGFLRTQPLVRLVDGLGKPDRPGYVELRGSWVASSVHPAIVEAGPNWTGSVVVKPQKFPAMMGPGAATIGSWMGPVAPPPGVAPIVSP